MRIKSRGFCLIEVISAFSILIMSISVYLYVQTKVDKGLESSKKQAQIYMCTNSFYNYLNSCTDNQISALEGRKVNLQNLLGSNYSNFYVEIKINNQQYNDMLNNTYNAKILSIDIYMGNVVIEHYNFIKEI